MRTLAKAYFLILGSFLSYFLIHTRFLTSIHLLLGLISHSCLFLFHDVVGRKFVYFVDCVDLLACWLNDNGVDMQGQANQLP